MLNITWRLTWQGSRDEKRQRTLGGNLSVSWFQGDYQPYGDHGVCASCLSGTGEVSHPRWTNEEIEALGD